MWEDVLSIVDDETGNDQGRLFVQDDNWDGSQYLRYRFLSLSLVLGCFLHVSVLLSVLLANSLLRPSHAQELEHRVFGLACAVLELMRVCPSFFVHL